jgi:glutathione S-transferase
MITLYHKFPSRSVAVHWLLEELGVPYRLEILKENEQKSPAFLALNPMGKVPTIDHDGIIVSEAAAICCYLADAFSSANLAPAIGTRARGPYLKWLFFGPGCLEPAMIDCALKREPGPPQMLGYASFEAVVDVVANAVANVDYLVGGSFTAADVVIGWTLRLGMQARKIIPERVEFSQYLSRLEQRPAWQRVWPQTTGAIEAKPSDRVGRPA